MKVLVVGIGLIGGSIAKTIKKNSDWTVLGYDLNENSINDALSLGAIDAVWDKVSPCDADLTVLCLSPKACVDFLIENIALLKKNSVVTDVCGIKSWIVENCEKICEQNGLHFVGGHPMAGKERSGFKNSDENLFNRASYIITPTSNTYENALKIVEKYIKTLKAAKITVSSPANHDRVIAFTSQMPHVIAGSYVKSDTCCLRHGFSAGSFKDVSRVATVDENLWSELFLQNKDMLLNELSSFIDSLTEYKTALLNDDVDSLKSIIKDGRIIKENDLKEID